MCQEGPLEIVLYHAARQRVGKKTTVGVQGSTYRNVRVMPEGLNDPFRVVVLRRRKKYVKTNLLFVAA